MDGWADGPHCVGCGYISSQRCRGGLQSLPLHASNSGPRMHAARRRQHGFFSPQTPAANSSAACRRPHCRRCGCAGLHASCLMMTSMLLAVQAAYSSAVLLRLPACHHGRATAHSQRPGNASVCVGLHGLNRRCGNGTVTGSIATPSTPPEGSRWLEQAREFHWPSRATIPGSPPRRRTGWLGHFTIPHRHDFV